ncbi:Ulp1 protease family, C-terminal catalytic domain-containing protein [Carex littledalei]|uniref:Ulp1 protease family, C-terminal catalytic domain-containing protein n=1 Tax=Carex littledalei TaxID=544730 RepID=A0A833W1M8_9POAL|nr:Ulp1 protease family, C-terminal catalytic domain-containing protein [Carex littledalei]
MNQSSDLRLVPGFNRNSGRGLITKKGCKGSFADAGSSAKRNGIQFLISLALNTDNLLPTNYSDLNITKWPVVVTEVPQQKDDHSCGLFALKFIELRKGYNEFSMSLKVDDEDAELFRKQLVYQLLMNEKNTMEKVQKDIWDRVLSPEEYK